MRSRRVPSRPKGRGTSSIHWPRPASADEVPLRRFGKMDELRNLLIFLMSDGCSYITGDTISIDGGHHLAAPSTFAGLAKLSPADWQRAREAIQASVQKEKQERSI